MKITFLGHAAVLAETGSHRVLIDPFISGNPMCPLSLSEIGPVDAVLLSHGHSDHLGDTEAICRKYDAVLVCNYEIALYFGSRGLKTHGMHIGGSHQFGFGKVKLTPALHGSSLLDNGTLIYAGNPAGFLLTMDGKTLYHAGDTGLSAEMSLLKEEMIDLAMLPIGDNFTMGVADALRAVRMICPRHVIPVHFDTFDLIRADADAFLRGLPSGVTGEILRPGESVVL